MTLWVLKLLVPFVRHDVPPIPEIAESKECPELHTNWFSRLYWSWLGRLMYIGYFRPIDEKDLWQIDKTRRSGLIANNISKNFNIFKEKYHDRKALFYALKAVFIWPIFLAICFRITADTIQSCSTLFMRHILNFAQDTILAKRLGEPRPPISKGIGWCIGLFLMQCLSSLLTHWFFHLALMTGAKIRAGLIVMVYRKSLKLSNKARTNYTAGKITNIMSTDTYRIEYASSFGLLVVSVVQVLVCIILLLLYLGYSALPGIAVLLIVSPILGFAVKNLSKKRLKSTKFTDARIKLIQEILGAIRSVKMYAWENSFISRLNILRIKEITIIRSMLYVRAFLLSFLTVLPIFATILAFVVYAVTGHRLNPAEIFPSLSLFNILRLPLMLLPVGFAALSDAYVSMQRLYDFLVAEESPSEINIEYDIDNAFEFKKAKYIWEETEKSNNENDSDQSIESSKQSVKQANENETAEQKTNNTNDTKTFTESEKEIYPETSTLDTSDQENTNLKSQFELGPLDFTIPRGELTCIVGKVGSGKSSLFSAILGEMKIVHGAQHIGGNLAVCSQNAWILNTTVQNNILLSKPLDKNRYNEVLEACALLPDLELLDHGDQTEIGERGVTISGGQRQRINMARAAYCDADIVLLDDPLSAVDSHVGHHLFEYCINGLMKNKTRVLITHQIHVLNKVDKIFVMHNGKITESGTFNELLEKNQDFAQILKEFQKEIKTDNEVAKYPNEDKSSDAQKPYNTENSDSNSDMSLTKSKTKTELSQKEEGLMQKEDKAEGSVPFKTYAKYAASAGGYWVIPLIIGILAVAICANIANNLWLTYWVNNRFNHNRGWYVGIYVALGIVQAVMYLIYFVCIALFCTAASEKMSSKALNRLLLAPVAFFDTTPVGRILNRFSKDIDITDNNLVEAIRMFMLTMGQIIGTIILAIVFFYWFAIPVVPLLVLFYIVALFYRRTAREVKRLDALLRSFVFSHFGETLNGLSDIRAYCVQGIFMEHNENTVDRGNKAYLLTYALQRWLGVRLDLLANLLVFALALITVTNSNASTSAGIGLVLSYVLSLVGTLSWTIRQYTELENDMNSVERINHYAHRLTLEAPYIIPETKPKEDWPVIGNIEFDQIKLRYRPELPLVLKGVSFEVEGGQKVGIVGRTGAGKSSILMVLYRLSELEEGTIRIDGVDISKLGLHTLRSVLGVIPQEPIMFEGTIRVNLDPNEGYTDAEIWEALKQSHFLATVKLNEEKPFSLDTEIEDGGTNMSLGQKQLLALARALLKKPKILVLDEATSSVDFRIDTEIQETIRKAFKSSTILCIAHRLRTIIGYDKILVMKDGEKAEFDNPLTLYDDHSSIFYGMCSKSSIFREDIVEAQSSSK